MKKLLAVLMLAGLLAACGESSTDVATRGGGGGGDNDPFVPPDTVIKTENAVVDLYRPGNPVAIETVHSLTARSSFTDALATAGVFGYAFDPGDAAAAVGRSDDGRDIVVLLGSLFGMEGDGLILYIRVAESEYAVALRSTGRGSDDFEVMETASKSTLGPLNIPWLAGDMGDCIRRAMSEMVRCREDIGCPLCYFACVIAMAVYLVLCVALHMI